MSPQPNVGATPILTITTLPQQIPIGSGATVFNIGTIGVIISTDAIPTSANSFNLNPSSSLPLITGPYWASVTGNIVGQLLITNQSLNYFALPTATTPLTGIQLNTTDITVASGATNIDLPFPVSLGGVGPFQLWNYGFFGITTPSSGYVEFNVQGTAPLGSFALDVVGFNEWSSNRLAGTTFTNQPPTNALIVANATNVSLVIYATYSFQGAIGSL